MTFKIYSLMTLFLTFSCKDGKKTEASSTTAQMKEVMSIHDEIMPKLGKFGPLVGKLSSKEDSTEMGLKYKNAREDLQAAHKTMMEWMQDFGNKFDSDEILNGKELSETKKKWLSEEEEKIKALREQVNKSMSKAESLLNEE